MPAAACPAPRCACYDKDRSRHTDAAPALARTPMSDTANLPRLAEDDARFIQSGQSITLGSCNPALQPSIAVGLACRVAPDRQQISVMLRPSQSADLLRDVRSSGRIAVTVNQPTTHRTIQLKGCDARVHSIDAACIGEVAAQTSAFVEEIIAIGEPPEEMVRAYVQFELHDVIAISFTLQEVFVSTPGPTAGARLS